MRWANRFKKVSEILSVVILIAGSIVLAGWILDIPVLKSISPKFVTMKANTAISFIFVGISLWLLQEKRSGIALCRQIARLSAFIVLLIGSMTLFEYIFKCNLGIDQLLFKEPAIALLTSSPGRMAFNTSIIFTIIGAALLMTGFKTRFFSYLTQLMVILAGAISLLSFVGYLYGASPLYIGLNFSTAMALHTTVLFMMVCVSFLFARPTQAFMNNVSSDKYGSLALRRILPGIIFIPLALGWLITYSEKRGLFGYEFVAAFMSSMSILIIGALAYVLAAQINRMDDKRTKSELQVARAMKDWEDTFNAISEIITIHDMDFNIIHANKAAEGVFGRKIQEILGKKCFKMYHNRICPPEECPGCMVMKTGKECEGEFFEPFLNRYIDVRAFPRHDEKDNLIGVIHVVRDITERKKAEEEIKKHLREVKVFYESSIGREERILELKQRVAELEKGLREKP